MTPALLAQFNRLLIASTPREFPDAGFGEFRAEVARPKARDTFSFPWLRDCERFFCWKESKVTARSFFVPGLIPRIAVGSVGSLLAR